MATLIPLHPSITEISDEDRDDPISLEYRRRDFLDARTSHRQLEAIERHLFAPGAEGFAGWIVR